MAAIADSTVRSVPRRRGSAPLRVDIDRRSARAAGEVAWAILQPGWMGTLLNPADHASSAAGRATKAFLTRCRCRRDVEAGIAALIEALDAFDDDPDLEDSDGADNPIARGIRADRHRHLGDEDDAEENGDTEFDLSDYEPCSEDTGGGDERGSNLIRARLRFRPEEPDIPMGFRSHPGAWLSPR
ncbi:MAG TPA: hypothetical protein VGM87_09760 [Roseomonas sp.]